MSVQLKTKMKVQNEKSAVKRAGVRSAIAGAVGSRWRYAIAGAVSIWRRLAASGQRVGAFERQAAAESAEWQAKMSRAGRMFKAAPARLILACHSADSAAACRSNAPTS